MNITIPREAQREAEEIFRGEYNIDLPRAPRTVLDIGAHCGTFTLWALSHWPKCKVHAYEPSPDNAAMFRRNVKNKRATLHEMAVVTGDRKTAKLYKGENTLCNSVCSEMRVDKEEHWMVKCAQAHKIPSAEYVKIDAEGVEVDVINKLDLSKTLALTCEAHSELDRACIIITMNRQGFALVGAPRNSAGLWTMKFKSRKIIGDGKKLFVALPVYNEMDSFFAQSLMRLQVDRPCDLTMRTLVGDSLIPRARNTLVADFLETDCTHMLFIDSDLVFRPDHLRRLMSREEDVIGGFYPKKQQGPLHWVCNATFKPVECRKDAVQELRYIGTGFLRISRKAIEEMIAHYGDTIAFRSDHAPYRVEHDLFSVGVYKGRYLSEDWYFCQRWLDMGGKVWGDTSVWLPHIGKVSYPLNTQMNEISNPYTG